MNIRSSWPRGTPAAVVEAIPAAAVIETAGLVAD